MERWKADTFDGFDELWVAPSPTFMLPPATIGLLAPQARDDEIPPALTTWFRDAPLRLGLGDGSGTNFIAHDEASARALGLEPARS